MTQGYRLGTKQQLMKHKAFEVGDVVWRKGGKESSFLDHWKGNEEESHGPLLVHTIDEGGDVWVTPLGNQGSDRNTWWFYSYEIIHDPFREAVWRSRHGK